MESAWLFKIAHNVCLSRRRSSWRRGRIESPEDFQEMQDVLAAPTRGLADDLVGFQDVLEQMPENQRRAILLREWQGLSYREIATELHLSQAAVETLIFRARRALASGLEEALVERSWRKRLRRGADVGGGLAFLKTLLGGGGTAAVKVATVVALAGATVATTTADRLHPHQSGSAAKEASVAPSAAVTSTSGTSVSSDGLSSTSVTPLRDAASRPTHERSPRPSRASSPVSTTPSTESRPAPTSPQPAPVTATQETTSSAESAAPPAHLKAPKANGHAADPGKATGAPNPGKGTGKQEDPSVAPQPAPPAPAATAPEEGGSADHGRDTAPGQEKKDDTDTHGSGRAK
jgi:hypothetical protein